MGIHELCAHRAEDVVLAVLHEAQLPRVEDEADVVVLKVELLVAARRRPGDLTQQIFAFESSVLSAPGKIFRLAKELSQHWILALMKNLYKIDKKLKRFLPQFCTF